MNIFILGNFPPPYNGQNIGTKLMKDLLSGEFKTTVFRWNVGWYLTDNASKIEKLNYFSAALLKYYSVILKLWFQFFTKSPDILYIVPSSNRRGIIRDFLVYLPFLIKNKKIICHVRSGSFILNDPLFKKLYSRKNFKFIFLTDRLANTSLVEKDQYQVISNFIDPLFDTYENIEKSEFPIKIVYLSNLFSSKGIFDIIEAVKSVEQKDKFYLEIYGKGEQNVINKIEELIKDTHQISFKGEISDRDKIKNIYATSHIFTLPTTYKIEASPRSIIEALSQGCVPLVTNHAGIPDMVDEECAFMINKDENLIKQLTEVLNNLAQDSEPLAIKSKKSRQKFEKQFSYNIIKQNIFNFFIK